MGHAEWREEAVGRERGQGLSTDTSDHDGQQYITCVAIEVFHSRVEIEHALRLHQPQNVVDGVHCGSRRATGDIQESPLISESGCVSQQVTQGDRLTKLGNFRDIASDVIIESQFALE
jgi:hypothetical protein